MTVKEIDQYIDNLPRAILLTIIHNIMNEYQQVRRQVRIAIREMATDHKNNGIVFPNKNKEKFDYDSSKKI